MSDEPIGPEPVDRSGARPGSTAVERPSTARTSGPQGDPSGLMDVLWFVGLVAIVAVGWWGYNGYLDSQDDDEVDPVESLSSTSVPQGYVTDWEGLESDDDFDPSFGRYEPSQQELERDLEEAESELSTTRSDLEEEREEHEELLDDLRRDCRMNDGWWSTISDSCTYD